jgi:hypothetical protein
MKRAVVLGAALAFIILVIVSYETPSIVTDGDFAVAELYTELATGGALDVGPYSRFGWHHPGPMYFYVQAPLYAAAGHKAAAMYAGALAINLAALATLVWVLAREKRAGLAAVIGTACVFFAWRAPRFLASPWTAHVPIFPAAALLVICAAIAAGRTSLLPLAILCGTFVVQTHLGFVPTIAGAFVVAFAGLLVWRDNREPLTRRVLIVSAVLAGVLWTIPAVEAIRNDGGNIRDLVRFFLLEEGRQPSIGEAALNWGYGVSGVLRSDFALAWGGHFVAESASWGMPIAVAQVVILLVIAARDLRNRDRLDASLASMCAIATCVGLWAITRIRDDILDHEVFWLSLLGAVNLAVIAAAAFRIVERWRPIQRTADRRTSIVVCTVVVFLAAAEGTRAYLDFTAFERRRRERMAIVATYEAVRDYAKANGIRKPLFEIEGPMWSHAAGVLLRLEQAGVPFAVNPESLSIFTKAFAASGDEDVVVGIRRSGQDRPSAASVLVDARGVYVDVIRRSPPTR